MLCGIVQKEKIFGIGFPGWIPTGLSDENKGLSYGYCPNCYVNVISKKIPPHSTWYDLTFPSDSLLTSAKMTQLDGNLDALAEGHEGAPYIQQSFNFADHFTMHPGNSDNSNWIAASAGSSSVTWSSDWHAIHLYTGSVDEEAYYQFNSHRQFRIDKFSYVQMIARFYTTPRSALSSYGPQMRLYYNGDNYIGVLNSSSTQMRLVTMAGGSYTSTSFDLDSTSYHIYSIKASSSEVTLDVDGTTVVTHTTNIPDTVSLTPYIRSWKGGGTTDYDSIFDYVVLRAVQ